MGLIQRTIEQAGIPTIGISIVRDYSEKVKPPRTVFVRWPFGHPLGEPFKAAQHFAILQSAFEALYAIQTPGSIIDLPFKWRRHQYAQPSWMQNAPESLMPEGGCSTICNRNPQA